MKSVQVKYKIKCLKTKIIIFLTLQKWYKLLQQKTTTKTKFEVIFCITSAIESWTII